jgi:hypothetical protein
VAEVGPQPASRFSLLDPDRRTGHSALALDGRRVGTLIAGLSVAAQYQLDDSRILLVVDDDSPHDEGLHIYLLGPAGEVEDALEAGAPFCPGVFKLLAAGSTWVELEFFTNEVAYRLEIGARPTLRFRTPPGWRYRRILDRHRLSVRTLPLRRTGPAADPDSR